VIIHQLLIALFVVTGLSSFVSGEWVAGTIQLVALFVVVREVDARMRKVSS